MPDLPTNAAFKTALENMTVTGVAIHKGYPPEAISSGDLPMAFLELPSATLGDYALSCITNDKTRTMRYVVCLEAVGQSTQEDNYDRIATMMDNLETALDTALTSLANFYTYDMVAGKFIVAGNEYWAIITMVSVRSV